MTRTGFLSLFYKRCLPGGALWKDLSDNNDIGKRMMKDAVEPEIRRISEAGF
jgi:hypothetical protein